MPPPAHRRTLTPLVAETLRDLVGTWNIFIVGDPKGRALDEIRLGPQDMEAAKRVVVAAELIVHAIRSSGDVATLEAIDAVVEQAETAKTAPAGIDGDQAIDLSRKTTGNMVSELLRRAYAGSLVVYKSEIISFVVNNADALKVFVAAVWYNPTLVEIIDLIVRGYS